MAYINNITTSPFWKYLFLLCLLLSCLSCISEAQTEEATTTSGKKVILYPNGTWKYAVAEKDKPVVATIKQTKKADKESLVVPEACTGLLETITEQRTGVSTIRTVNIIYVSGTSEKGELSISMQKNSKGILTIFFHPAGAGDCIGEGNKIRIEFEDGTKADFGHEGILNCRGESAVNFLGNYGKKKQLEQLKTIKIRSVKVFTQQSYVLQQFSAANQEEFQQALHCLVAGN